MIGILASLRAVQHALLNHDKYISPAHGQVIDAWRKSTTRDGPELSFIASARNLILKEGAFDAYATRTESSIGEGCNYTVTAEDYDLVYYDGLERRDLLADLRGAVAWCERELADIEAKLP
jgi:hypothetical protein